MKMRIGPIAAAFLLFVLTAGTAQGQVAVPKLPAPGLLQIQEPDFVHPGEQLTLQFASDIDAMWVSIVPSGQNKIYTDDGLLQKGLPVTPQLRVLQIEGIPGESVTVQFQVDRTMVVIQPQQPFDFESPAENDPLTRVHRSRNELKLEFAADVSSIWIQFVAGDRNRILLGSIPDSQRLIEPGDVFIWPSDELNWPGDDVVMIEGVPGEAADVHFLQQGMDLVVKPNDPWNLDLPTATAAHGGRTTDRHFSSIMVIDTGLETIKIPFGE